MWAHVWRLARTGRWIGLALCLLLAALLALSAYWAITLRSGAVRVVQLRAGQVGYNSIISSRHWPRIVDGRSITIDRHDLAMAWTIRWPDPSRGYSADFPIWIGLAVLAAPTALLWWLAARAPPGLCRRCGYSVAGIASGVCPECGVPLARR